jgi:hypothetical protein
MPTRTALTAPDHACPRCRGLLLVERFAYAHAQIYCVNCGHRLCPVMAANRAAPPPRKDDYADHRTIPQPIPALPF